MAKAQIDWNDLPRLMDEARATARRLLRRERNAHSLPTTALVLTGLRRQRLVGQDWDEVAWPDPERFLAALYRAMERALQDHGRRRRAKKRRALQWVNIEELTTEEALRTAQFQLHDVDRSIEEFPETWEALSEALEALEREHPAWAGVARHRYYGALTIEQTAQLMGVAERTVRRQWEKARVLLHDEILRNLRALGHDI